MRFYSVLIDRLLLLLLVMVALLYALVDTTEARPRLFQRRAAAAAAAPCVGDDQCQVPIDEASTLAPVAAATASPTFDHDMLGEAPPVPPLLPVPDPAYEHQAIAEHGQVEAKQASHHGPVTRVLTAPVRGAKFVAERKGPIRRLIARRRGC